MTARLEFTPSAPSTAHNESKLNVVAMQVVSPEASARGALSANTDTYVDDGIFNKLQAL